MGEIENAVRQIVREEIAAYVKGHGVDDLPDVKPKDAPGTGPDRYNDDLFEQKYQAARKMDEEVRERYQSEVEQHGETITLEHAASLLKMSRYAIRKLSKEDLNFPPIVRGTISTARLMHWLDGGRAYWHLRDSDD